MGIVSFPCRLLSCFNNYLFFFYIFIWDEGLILYTYRNGFVLNEMGNREVKLDISAQKTS